MKFLIGSFKLGGLLLVLHLFYFILSYYLILSPCLLKNTFVDFLDRERLILSNSV